MEMQIVVFVLILVVNIHMPLSGAVSNRWTGILKLTTGDKMPCSIWDRSLLNSTQFSPACGWSFVQVTIRFRSFPFRWKTDSDIPVRAKSDGCQFIRAFSDRLPTCIQMEVKLSKEIQINLLKTF